MESFKPHPKKDWRMRQGTYFIKAVVDPADLIDEFNETNNNCTLVTPITIYVPTAPGELSVDKALARVISGPDPPVVGYTTVYELMIVVANPGRQRCHRRGGERYDLGRCHVREPRNPEPGLGILRWHEDHLGCWNARSRSLREFDVSGERDPHHG